uniref:MAM domain containing 2 n=1 Tax=Tetraodon nigroviridis TaxID=99883 RepID=H3DMT5_TETNG
MVLSHFTMSIFFSLTEAIAQAQSQLLPGSCNFESSTCGYTSDGEFTSWNLHKDGIRVLCDTTGYKAGRKQEITGTLVSPVLEYSEWSCLRLVYQIMGSGSLKVLQRTEGKSFDKPLWSGQTPSDSWVITSMDLKNNTESYKIIIEGKPGQSAGSSVAIFEIHIVPGYCLECDFEESHLCGYSNQWNANVNWYVGGGRTQLLHNNIPNDHTFNNKTGHLMYVDSVYAKTFKEVAKLVSPMTTVPLSGCLSFQYQRSDERGNIFSVFTRDHMGQYQELWRAGAQNESDWSGTLSEWIPVQVDLKAPYSIQVVFEVAFNSPSGGRVAVDDISFSPQFCNKDNEPPFDPATASCNFEAGLCHYTLDNVAGSSWRRVLVKRNIFQNGDHTTGTAGSFLLAHSQSRHSGYISRLIGQTLPGNMKYCLRFFYSLSAGFNQTHSALMVYVQQQQSGTQEKIWTQGEKSRGIWIAADVTFQISQPAKLVFISSCRDIWDCNSVALDDISLNLGDCNLATVSLASVLPGHCDFEAGLCDYSQDKQDDGADWEWRRGPTPTSYTGPRGDHSTGLGYYLYMEASATLPGQSIRLLSRPLRGFRGSQCLQFYYHMYGSGTGELNLHLKYDSGEKLLWQQSGEQSISWLRATVEFQHDSQHQIVFEATRGASVRSDIAIDDIVLEGGPCQGKYPLPSSHF